MKSIKTSGFSLIELSISLALGLLLTSLLITFYFQEQDQNRYEMQLSRMQENASLISQILQHDIQSAGYVGCAKLTNSFPISNDIPGVEFTPDNAIKGYHDDKLEIVIDNLLKNLAIITTLVIARHIYYNFFHENPLEQDVPLANQGAALQQHGVFALTHEGGENTAIVAEPSDTSNQQNGAGASEEKQEEEEEEETQGYSSTAK